MARVYADVNARLGPSWYDYGQSSAPLLHASWLLERCVLTPPTESLSVDWNVPDRYEIVRRIGGGRYSEVRAALVCKHTPEAINFQRVLGLRGY